MLSFVANIPRGVLGTRMNPGCVSAGQIGFEYGYVLEWKMFFADLKNIMCYLFPSSETTSRTQDQEFLLSFFQLSSDEKLLEE